MQTLRLYLASQKGCGEVLPALQELQVGGAQAESRMTYSIYSISTQGGVVLYVGMSINVEKRFSKHRTNRIVSQYAPVSFAVLATRKSKEAALRFAL
jgi:hypothetical protein